MRGQRLGTTPYSPLADIPGVTSMCAGERTNVSRFNVSWRGVLHSYLYRSRRQERKRARYPGSAEYFSVTWIGVDGNSLENRVIEAPWCGGLGSEGLDEQSRQADQAAYHKRMLRGASDLYLYRIGARRLSHHVPIYADFDNKSGMSVILADPIAVVVLARRRTGIFSFADGAVFVRRCNEEAP